MFDFDPFEYLVIGAWIVLALAEVLFL